MYSLLIGCYFGSILETVYDKNLYHNLHAHTNFGDHSPFLRSQVLENLDKLYHLMRLAATIAYLYCGKERRYTIPAGTPRKFSRFECGLQSIFSFV